jgi:hypothetical protein
MFKTKRIIMNVETLVEAIQAEVEWLETTEGDEIECIGIENLEGILSKYLGTSIKLTQDGNI